MPHRNNNNLSRREARDLAFQFLFSCSELHSFSKSDFDLFCFNFGSKPDEYSWNLCESTKQKQKEIDASISANSAHWKIERMPKVDLTILRLATFEIVFEKDMPKSVAINEAIELAKKYGSEDSAAFVNGILDKFSKTE